MQLVHTRLLIPALLSVILLIGSASAKIMVCPDIPPGPYIPKSPEEDIVKVEAYIEHVTLAPSSSTTEATISSPYLLHLTVTFAAPTPPADQAICILVTALQGTPQTETVIGCLISADPTSTTYTLDPIPLEDAQASVAVYAWLGEIGTDRAPNTDSYQITSLSAEAPNLFYDPEPAPVGGVVIPKSKLEILTPYLALAGLVAAVSAVVVAKKRSVA